MGSQSQCAVYAKCPYYRKEAAKEIRCEGLLPKSSSDMIFEDAPKGKEYEKYFCKGDWSKCVIARMHNERYESDV